MKIVPEHLLPIFQLLYNFQNDTEIFSYDIGQRKFYVHVNI